MQESKENQPDSFGDAPVSKDNQHNSFGEDAPVTRREMERWEQGGRIEMEARELHIRDEFKEVQRQFEALAGKIEEVADVADRVEEMSGQMNQLLRMVQQVIDNNKPAAAAEAASNIDGPGRRARERQIQKLELGNDVALWRKLGPRRHWFIRGWIPPSTVESVANLQAMLGDMLEVTPEVAQQLRSLGGFEILGFRLRMDGGFNDRDVPVADRFDLLRQALGAILSLGLKDTVAADALCLARTHKLNDCFVDANTSLRAHVLKYYDFLEGRETIFFLGDMINDDLRLWIGDLTRICLLYTSPSPRDKRQSRMPSSA